ncbi:hypothetical protein [Nocardioides sp.]|uniref:SWIM zinc finger family protein n=1 Tax=Nocardioides sp. TaxID=35761 RepID=UPI003D0EDB24
MGAASDAGITYPRFQPRARAARATSWWGKAWVRATEESAYGEGDLRRSRSDARAGLVGGITIESGSFFAAVRHGDDTWSPRIDLPVLDPVQRAAFVEVVASRSGRIAVLLAGGLPHDLVEDAEESGVELLPYGGEFDASCPCDAWTQPCVHALAVLHQCAWLIDDDPFVLLSLRGLSREELLAALHAREDQAGRDPEVDELDTAYDAAVRAQRLIDDLDASPDV